MGQLLEQPIIQKGSSTEENNLLWYGESCMQGYRVSMEDRATCQLDQVIREDLPKVNFFGIFDGHSGQNAAQFCAGCLWNHMKEFEQRRIGSNPEVTFFSDDHSLEESFLTCDDEFAGTFKLAGDTSGTTCISVVVVPTAPGIIDIICCNVGDSRSVLFDRGQVFPLSHDHKPMNKGENARIVAAGGFVEFGRVNGTLALSRAFGDLSYKGNPKIPARQQIVTACPEMERLQVDFNTGGEGFTFILLACDGVWDVLTNEQAAEFVHQRLQQQKQGSYGRIRSQVKSQLYHKPELKLDKRTISIFIPELAPGEFDLACICEDLIDHCVLELDSKDNVSAGVVLFRKQD